MQTPQSWPMFGANAGLTAAVEGSLPDSLELIWRFSTGGVVKSPPVIEDGLVFAGSADANETWLVFGSYDSKVYCLNSADGRFV